MNAPKQDGWASQPHEQEQVEPVTIGSKVAATWPSGWQLGGTVVSVITPMGQEPSYSVRFSTGAHHTFSATNVTLST